MNFNTAIYNLPVYYILPKILLNQVLQISESKNNMVKDLYVDDILLNVSGSFYWDFVLMCAHTTILQFNLEDAFMQSNVQHKQGFRLDT